MGDEVRPPFSELTVWIGAGAGMDSQRTSFDWR